MEKKVLGFLDYGNLLWRKLRTIETIEDLHFRCIKARITPVSCKIRSPQQLTRSYQIIQKLEKKTVNVWKSQEY